MISKKQILEAYQRIKPYINQTPQFYSSHLNSRLKANLIFKAENFQKVGAFKARGAFNFALQLTKDSLNKGLCTHSSGNHAQAVSLAAKTLQAKAYIVMPNNAPRVKIEAVKNYGAQITFCEPNLLAREETLKQIQQTTQATFVPPYNHKWIIAGQATAALELLQKNPNLDYIIAPVGGGGLLSGSCLSAFYFGQKVKVIGAEPLGASDAYKSFRDKKLYPSTNPTTIADGLLTSLGEINFEIIKEYTKDILLASDIEILRSMKFIWERMKLVVEPSAATALAVVEKNAQLFENKKIGIILSGGNVDLNKSYFTFANK